MSSSKYSIKSLVKRIVFFTLMSLPILAAQKEGSEVKTEIKGNVSLDMLFQQLILMQEKCEKQTSEVEKSNKILEDNNNILKEEVKELKEGNNVLKEEVKELKKDKKILKRNDIIKSNAIKTEKKEKIEQRNRNRRRRRTKKRQRKIIRENRREQYRDKLIQDWRDECKKVSKKSKKDGDWSLGLGVASLACSAAAPFTGGLSLIPAAGLFGAQSAKAVDSVCAEFPDFQNDKIDREVQLRYPSSDEDISADEQIPNELLQLEDVPPLEQSHDHTFSQDNVDYGSNNNYNDLSNDN